MDRMKPSELMQRIKLADGAMANWRSLLDDAYQMTCPGRNQFGGDRTPGDQPGNSLFDSTLLNAHGRFANRIMQSLFPEFQSWTELVPGDVATQVLKADQSGQGQEELKEIEARATAVTNVVFASINGSNFSQAIHEFLLDYAFGTGAMLINDKPLGTKGVFECVPVNPAFLSLDEGANGNIWGIFRKHEMKPHQAEATWPDADWPEEWKEISEKSYTANTKIKFEEATYYDSDRDRWYFDVLAHIDSQGKTVDAPVCVVKREYKKNRWIIARWMKNTGEAFGRGPVLQALPTAKTLNKAMELLLINGSVSIHKPMTFVDDGVINAATFDLSPGAMNPVGYNSGSRGASVEPLNLGGDLRLTQFIFEQMQMEIKKIMLDDQLPPDQGSVRSATEWNARQNELRNAIGAPFGRLFAEFHRPFMDVMVDVHKAAGIIKDKDFTLDGQVVDLIATSPFAQAENVNEVNTMAQFIELTMMLGEETFRATVKQENIAGFYANKMGISTLEFVRTAVEQRKEKEAMLEEQKALLAQQTQANVEEEAGKAEVQQGAQ